MKQSEPKIATKSAVKTSSKIALDTSQFRLVPLFRDIEHTTLADIATHARWRDIDAGETLFSQGDAGKHFFLVKSGAVKLYLLSENGQEHILEIISRERTFAEAVMFMGGNYPVYASALENTRLIAFDSTHFRRLLQDNPRLCLSLLAAMSRQLHALVADIDRISLQSGTQRLTQYLLAQPAHTHDNRRVLQLPASKQAIASLLDIRPETLSRIFSRLTEEGLLRVEGDTVTILAVNRLNQM
jgi:CRP-like cAMP-binding protein